MTELDKAVDEIIRIIYKDISKRMEVDGYAESFNLDKSCNKANGVVGVRINIF